MHRESWEILEPTLMAEPQGHGPPSSSLGKSPHVACTELSWGQGLVYSGLLRGGWEVGVAWSRGGRKPQLLSGSKSLPLPCTAPSDTDGDWALEGRDPQG